jgi:hypothetical protein
MTLRRWRKERQLKKKCEICYRQRKLMLSPFCRHDPKYLAQIEEMSQRTTPYVFTKEDIERLRIRGNNEDE